MFLRSLNFINTRIPPAPYFKAAGILIIISILLYGNSLNNEFMMDDFGYIQKDKIPSAFQSLPDFFIKTVDQHYNPLYKIINVFLFQTFKEPPVFRAINITLLAFCSFALYLLVYFWTSQHALALLTSVLFCVHPLNAATVVLNNTIPIFLFLLFMEISLILLALFCNKGQKPLFYGLSLSCLILALLSLEFALLFPLYAFYALYFLKKYNFKKSLALSLPFFGICLIYLFIWFAMAGHAAGLGERIRAFPITPGVFSATFFHGMLWYISKLFLPDKIVVIHDIALIRTHILLWNALFILSLGAALGAIIRFWKKDLKSFALATFLTGFLITTVTCLGHLPSALVMEPNWFLFSSIGFFLFAAKFLLLIKNRFGDKIFIAAAGTACLYFSAFTFVYTHIARRELTFNEHWLRYSPGNIIPMMSLSTIYSFTDNLDIPADLMPDMLDMVEVYARHRAYQPAIDLLEKIIAADNPPVPREDLLIQLAVLHLKNRDARSAQHIINALLSARPRESSPPYAKIIHALQHAGENQAALALLEQALVAQPQNKELYLLKGIILANQEKYEAAISWWDRGEALDTQDPRFERNKKEALRLMKMTE